MYPGHEENLLRAADARCRDLAFGSPRLGAFEHAAQRIEVVLPAALKRGRRGGQPARRTGHLDLPVQAQCGRALVAAQRVARVGVAPESVPKSRALAGADPLVRTLSAGQSMRRSVGMKTAASAVVPISISPRLAIAIRMPTASATTPTTNVANCIMAICVMNRDMTRPR